MAERGRETPHLRTMVASMVLATIGFALAGCASAPLPVSMENGPEAVPAITADMIEAAPLVYSSGTRAPGAATDAPLWFSAPVSIAIPAIGVNAPLITLGLLANGTMDVPQNGTQAGWYNGSVGPGEMGPSVIVGHVDWDGPAVFFHLTTLVAGDMISVTRADGSIAAFRVTSAARYPKDEFPDALVYGGTTNAALRLITCSGVFDTKSGHYDDNYIVFAELVSSWVPGQYDAIVPPPDPVPARPRLMPHQGNDPVAV